MKGSAWKADLYKPRTCSSEAGPGFICSTRSSAICFPGPQSSGEGDAGTECAEQLP